ncbi:MAG: 3-hydroxyacyl-ACP dehydratase FabZ family protein [Clostridiaceae bacterium]
MNNIESLIPHRAPFLFVDEIISAEREEIVGVKTYGEDFYYYQENSNKEKIVPSTIIVESMGQCGGAGIKQLGIGGDSLYGFAIMEDIRFYDNAKFGDTVKMVVKNLNITNRAIKQSGVAYCNEKVIAEATWMCARL